METDENARIKLAPLMMTFQVICELGSLTAAAEQLGVGKAMVSKRLRQLEQLCGATLLERSTRRFVLTNAGRMLLQHAEQLHRTMSDALDDITLWQSQPQGQLKITAADILSQDVADITQQFRQTYPQVEVYLDLQDHKHDLIAEGFDLGLRYGWCENEALVAKCFVAADPQAIVIKKSALKHYPQEVDDLAQLMWIVPDPKVVDFSTWPVTHPDGRTLHLRINPAVICNDSQQIKQMLLGGAGVGIWPRRQMQEPLDNGSMVQLLPEWQLPAPQIYALYPPAKSVSHNARLWLEMTTRFYRSVSA